MRVHVYGPIEGRTQPGNTQNTSQPEHNNYETQAFLFRKPNGHIIRNLHFIGFTHTYQTHGTDLFWFSTDFI